MRLAMIGLGKMGYNMGLRLMRHGHEVVGFDLNEETVQEFRDEGGEGATALEEVVAKLDAPRVVWVMVPAGKPVEYTLDSLKELLDEGDIIIDGGNSNYQDTIRRGQELAEHGIHFVDAGVSGGIWGLENGYCLMVGGEREAVAHVEPIFICLSPEHDTSHSGPEPERPEEALADEPIPGYAHVGPCGAGHFVKMVHNGIEYGLMEAYAEGFEIMSKKAEFALDLGQIANLWMHASVVRSWLLELTARALEQEGNELASIEGYVPDSGEGRWTVVEAIDLDVPAPAITISLQQRFRSRQPESYAAKMLAAMRNQFGGHAVRRIEEEG